MLTGEFMLKFPKCYFCKEFMNEKENECCNAYTEGIPSAIIDSNMAAECAPGYSFKDTCDQIHGEPPKDGLYSKLLDVIGS